MILLASTVSKLQVVTGSIVTGMDVHASWMDLATSGTVTPGATNTVQITGATTTDVVAAPAVSTARNVKLLSIRNAHASSSNAITVQHTDGTTTTTLVKCTLLAGYTLCYEDGPGWYQVDSSGTLLQGTPAAGRFLQSTVLSGSSGTFTTRADTKSIRIRGVGAGGGGGGCSSVASAASAGGGGGAGGYLEKVVAVSPSTGYAYTCGAAGGGVSGAGGNNGVDSTFVVGATTYTAKGGNGAPVATALTTLSAYKGGAGGTVSTNGDVNGAGMQGEAGFIVNVTGNVGCSGSGGSGVFGAGGGGISTAGNGANAAGFGGGGGGAITGASAVRTGGNGTGGLWVVEEFS